MMGKGFGLARYVEQLILGLEKNDTTNEYVLFVTSNNKQQFANGMVWFPEHMFSLKRFYQLEIKSFVPANKPCQIQSLGQALNTEFSEDLPRLH